MKFRFVSLMCFLSLLSLQVAAQEISRAKTPDSVSADDCLEIISDLSRFYSAYGIGELIPGTTDGSRRIVKREPPPLEAKEDKYLIELKELVGACIRKIRLVRGTMMRASYSPEQVFALSAAYGLIMEIQSERYFREIEKGLLLLEGYSKHLDKSLAFLDRVLRDKHLLLRELRAVPSYQGGTHFSLMLQGMEKERNLLRNILSEVRRSSPSLYDKQLMRDFLERHQY